MCVYRFDSVALAIEPGELATALGLHRLCASLGSQLLAGSSSNGMRVATLRLHAHGADIPPGAKVRHDTRGFRIFGDTGGSYVSDGASTLSIHGERSEADAYLDESFHQKPRFLQWQFWSFCILTLLRPLGYFGLHAAALVSPEEAGLLIVGPSGSGKSTLAVGLIRTGWGYLSDDAALLCRRGDTVCALPLRTQFYVDGAAASSYVDFRLGHEAVDAAGGVRRQLHIDDHYATRRVAESRPGLLIFPTIVNARHSTAVRLDAASAVQRLLAASGPQLFDRLHMTEHMALLRCLVRQARAYRLDAGRDLHREPAGVLDLIPLAERP